MVSCTHDDRLPDRGRVEQVEDVLGDPLGGVVAVHEHEVDVPASSAKRASSSGSSRWLSPVWNVTFGSSRAPGAGSTRSKEWTSALWRGDPGEAAALGRADLDREAAGLSWARRPSERGALAVGHLPVRESWSIWIKPCGRRRAADSGALIAFVSAAQSRHASGPVGTQAPVAPPWQLGSN